MSNSLERFLSLPGRLLLDTCTLNMIQDEGAYIFEGGIPEGITEMEIPQDLKALRYIFQVNERASFQFLVSSLTFAELTNAKDIIQNQWRIQWALDVLNTWLIVLQETGDRVAEGGTVRHRFKLTEQLQELESRLMSIPDFRRDPLDRLLLIQYKMGNCDAFLTIDRNTIWRHRDWLLNEGIRILSPSEFWELLKPYAAIWY
jgi:predicted nucleic acid-binding protein